MTNSDLSVFWHKIYNPSKHLFMSKLINKAVQIFWIKSEGDFLPVVNKRFEVNILTRFHWLTTYYPNQPECTSMVLRLWLSWRRVCFGKATSTIHRIEMDSIQKRACKFAQEGHNLVITGKINVFFLIIKPYI